MKLTPQAKILWNEIPKDVQVRLLNNVFCVDCGETGIGNVMGVVKDGNLILRGICTKCGGPVARVIEND
jgi:hypothetical protein